MSHKSLKTVNPTFLDVSPEKVKARQYCNLIISFSIDKDLPKYSSIKFRFRGGRNNKNDWYILQSEDSSSLGYASLKTKDSNDFIPILITGKELSIKFVIVSNNGIRKGTQINFNVYNTLSQSLEENNKPIEIFIELPDKQVVKVKPNPSITVVAQKFDHLSIICPSTVKPSESFDCLLRIEDKYYNLYDQLRGNISLQMIDNRNSIKSNLRSIQIETKKESKGIVRLRNFQINHPGIYCIQAYFLNKMYSSNPIWCRNKCDQSLFNLYWGFIHGHSNLSDGIRDLEEFYENLLNASLDFGTTTEHDHSWETSDADFNRVKEIVEKYNSREDFTSFFGYEYGKWYSGQGDICIYSKNNNLEIFRSEINKFNSLKKLFKNLKKVEDGDILLIAHHTALKSGYRNWDFFDNHLEKLVEIYSTWGNQEYSSRDGNPLPPRYKFFGYGKYAREKGAIIEKKGSTVIDALKKGYKLGFVAGGDDHFGNYPSGPIQPDTGMYSHGILAIWSKNNTREEIWNSLLSRRCFGTTGPRLILEFSIDDRMMGEIIEINDRSSLNSYRLFKFRIISPIKVKYLEVVRNGVVFVKKNYNAVDIEDDFTDTDLFKDIAHTHVSKTEFFIFYYLRVFLDFENMAWSSPIWIINNK